MTRPERCLRRFRLAPGRSELSRARTDEKSILPTTTSASVSVIDTVNLVVTATIPVAQNPQESDITIDGTRLFVVHHHQQVVSVIDLATNTVIQVVSIGVPPAEGKTATDIAFTPDGRYALVPNYAKNVVDFIDTTTYAVTASPPGTNLGEWPSRQMGDAPSWLTLWVIPSRRLTRERKRVVGTVPTGDWVAWRSSQPAGHPGFRHKRCRRDRYSP